MKAEEITRPLDVTEIDFRIQSINNGGYATILAYKDARVDMIRLDAAFGVLGWQRRHEVINGNLFCSVGLWDELNNTWIWKQDVGTESNTEKEKGQASDAFKRACFNIGIGRELYDYPLIQIKLKQDEFQVIEQNGKKIIRPTYGLNLRDWRWSTQFEEGKLSFIGCKDTNGDLRYSWGTFKK